LLVRGGAGQLLNETGYFALEVGRDAVFKLGGADLDTNVAAGHEKSTPRGEERL